MLGEKPQTPSCWVETISATSQNQWVLEEDPHLPICCDLVCKPICSNSMATIFYCNIYIYMRMDIHIANLVISYNKPTYLRLHRKSHRNPDLFGCFFNPQPWDTLRTIRRWWSEAILASNMVLLGNPLWSILKKCHVGILTPPIFRFHGPWKIINEDLLLPWLPGKNIYNKIQWFFQTAYLSCQL